MKIAFLAGYNTIHTVRWVNSLCQRGHEVHLLSLHDKGDSLDPRIKKVLFPFPPGSGYYLNAPFVKYYLKRIKPDLINAHYASGYGTLGRLSGCRPYVLSVWGSDVYDFPKDSMRNRKLVIKNLMSADMVCSTSHAMANATRDLCPGIKNMRVAPFGVSTQTFCPDNKQRTGETITVGTVKRLKTIYGIDILIRSFARMRKSIERHSPQLSKKLRLVIVGEGPEKRNLMQLTADLGVEDVTRFEGAIPYSEVPSALRKIDIYAALSRMESFGVAIIEASSCGVPVVVSDTDGPREVVKDAVTGLIVPREDVEMSAAAIERLVNDAHLRNQLGIAGRSHVIENYEWERCVDLMEQIYRDVLKP